MAAVGMLSGYCGTLMTPMAANYNIVPVALLELPDQHAVIKAQADKLVADWSGECKKELQGRRADAKERALGHVI